MTEGIDDGFAEGLAVNFWHIDADESIEPHADADVLEDVFFCFLDECEDVTGEIVLIDDGRGGGRGEEGTAKGQGRSFAKEYPRSIQFAAIDAQAEAFEGGLRIGPGQIGFADVLADFFRIEFEARMLDGLGVPGALAAVFLENDFLDFLGGKLAVFIGDAHVGATMGVIRFLVAGEGDTDAGFSLQRNGGNFWIDFRFDVGSDRLGDFSQGGFGNVHADGFAIISDAKPQLATAMFVENGRHGMEAFAEFCEAFFEFDGF